MKVVNLLEAVVQLPLKKEITTMEKQLAKIKHLQTIPTALQNRIS